MVNDCYHKHIYFLLTQTIETEFEGQHLYASNITKKKKNADGFQK